jgi:hypothetical protein
MPHSAGDLPNPRATLACVAVTALLGAGAALLVALQHRYFLAGPSARPPQSLEVVAGVGAMVGAIGGYAWMRVAASSLAPRRRAFLRAAIAGGTFTTMLRVHALPDPGGWGGSGIALLGVTLLWGCIGLVLYTLEQRWSGRQAGSAP